MNLLLYIYCPICLEWKKKESVEIFTVGYLLIPTTHPWKTLFIFWQLTAKNERHTCGKNTGRKRKLFVTHNLVWFDYSLKCLSLLFNWILSVSMWDGCALTKHLPCSKIAIFRAGFSLSSANKRINYKFELVKRKIYFCKISFSSLLNVNVNILQTMLGLHFRKNSRRIFLKLFNRQSESIWLCERQRFYAFMKLNGLNGRGICTEEQKSSIDAVLQQLRSVCLLLLLVSFA